MPTSVIDAIEQRRTSKIRVSPDAPLSVPPEEFGDLMTELMELGARAPHHYSCDPSHQAGPMASSAPWRFHALTGLHCRRLMDRVLTMDGQVDKVASQLAAANGLIMVTWLPDPPKDPLPPEMLFDPTRRNMEHVAGTAAAVQNILLAATAMGVRTYWSSGGILRSDTVFEWLDIPREQILLGAVFLFPDPPADIDDLPGAHHRQQGPAEAWMRWVTV